MAIIKVERTKLEKEWKDNGMNLKNKINKNYLEISLYVIFTCVVIFILSRMTDKIGMITTTALGILNWLKGILTPVIIGFIIAYLLLPMLEKIEALLKKVRFFQKWKSVRGLAVGIQSILIFAIIFVVISMLISVITKQAKAATIEGTIEAIKSIANSINVLYQDALSSLRNFNISSSGIETYIEDTVKNMGTYLLDMSKWIGGFLDNLKNILATALFSTIFAIYFLLDAPGLKAYWGRVFKTLFPNKAVKVFSTIIEDADRVFSGYIRGQFIDAIIMAVSISIALSIAGTSYALVIGLLTGLGALVPYMSGVMGYGSTIIVGIITGDMKMMFVALVIIFVIYTIDGNVINPKLLSQSINIHPMIVIISLIIGGKVGGFMGMLVAVPIGGLCKLWFNRLIKLKEEKQKKGEKSEKNNIKKEEQEGSRTR